MDLAGGLLTDGPGGAPDAALRGFEALDVTGMRRLTMIGTAGSDELVAGGCTTYAYGRGGDDVLAGENHNGDFACTVSVRFRGGPGDDRLSGSEGRGESGEPGYAGNDRLIGGRGFDRADGRGGRHDLCRAEVRRRCERR